MTPHTLSTLPDEPLADPPARPYVTYVPSIEVVHMTNPYAARAASLGPATSVSLGTAEGCVRGLFSLEGA